MASTFLYAMANDFDFILMEAFAVVVEEIESHDSRHFMFYCSCIEES